MQLQLSNQTARDILQAIHNLADHVQVYHQVKHLRAAGLTAPVDAAGEKMVGNRVGDLLVQLVAQAEAEAKAQVDAEAKAQAEAQANQPIDDAQSP